MAFYAMVNGIKAKQNFRRMKLQKESRVQFTEAVLAIYMKFNCK